MVTISATRPETISSTAMTAQNAAVVATSGELTPICRLLANDGFSVDLMQPCELLDGSNRPYDLVLLDLAEFDGHWQDACIQLRARHEATPIVVLSEQSSTTDRIRGFDSGADEFIDKPYAGTEVSARLRSLMRRSVARNAMMRSGEQILDLRYGDLILDLASRVAYRDETRIDLSRREFALLSFFVQNSEQILSREVILKNVWGTVRKHDSNVVDVYVNYLRNKTEQGKHTRLIHTVRRKGYVLNQRPLG
jgi:DNA-binding response OmpR family regulator